MLLDGVVVVVLDRWCGHRWVDEEGGNLNMRVEHALQRASLPGPGLGPAEELSGTWVNELGSTMTLDAGHDGTLTGSYTSAVGDTNTYPLVGNADANAASFVVAFTESGSITAWAGHYNPASGQLELLWHLVEQPVDGADWAATLAGFDAFTQT